MHVRIHPRLDHIAHLIGLRFLLMPPVERSGWEVLCHEVSSQVGPDASEALGRRVGARVVLRLVPPSSAASGQGGGGGSVLDTFKFFCKEVWVELYGKKVDRLQTNHRGVFMFTDLAFPPLARVRDNHAQFMALHKGIVTGALMNLGLEVVSVALEVLAPQPHASDPASSGACFTITLNKY